MAKRRKDDGEGVSLFPFLSILACVIGVLTLLIALLSLMQMDPAKVEEIIRAEEYAEKKEEFIASKRELDDLQRLLSEANIVAKTLADAKAQLEKLQKEKNDTKVDPADEKKIIQLLADTNRLQTQIKALEESLKVILAEIEKLEAELADRQLPPDPAKTKIRPAGGGVLKGTKPVFFEGTKEGIVIYEDNKAPVRIPHGAITHDKRIYDILERIFASKGQLRGVVLVRDNALHSHDRLYHHARNAHGVGLSRLPIVGQGKVDLSAFKIKILPEDGGQG